MVAISDEEIECDCERMRVQSKAVHWACNGNPEVTVISRRSHQLAPFVRQDQGR
jgi:hypothetical protein